MIIPLKKTDLLTESLERFDFKNPPTDPNQLATDLIETMNHYQGVGLAANQCGLPYRVFVVKGSPNYVMFNPVIVNTSEETDVLEEGCLSFPNLVVKIKRPNTVRVRFMTPNGQVTTKTFSGMTARVIQHEYDHIEGILFFDRASRFHRERAFKNKKILDRRQKRKEKDEQAATSVVD